MTHLVRACLPLAACFLLLASSCASAAPILAPGDFIIAIDLDAVFGACQSSSPGNEQVYNILDANSGSKYLNFGEENSGFIVTTVVYPKQTVTSFMITTANDAEPRDPASWALYGTNETIVSTDHSFGDAENWTFIASGDVALPSARYTAGPVVSLTNSTQYASYKMLFPTVKNAASANSMQIADVEFYSTENPGITCLTLYDTILAIDADKTWVGSSYPNTQVGFFEDPAKCIDGIVGTDPSTIETKGTKYLNFGGQNSGFIVTPSAGATTITGFQITTADDNNLYPDRTPTSWALWGTNDPITSGDNTNGGEENWTLIGEGPLTLSDVPYTVNDLVAVDNTTAYTSYRMVFPTLFNAGTIMQIEEIQFFDATITPTDHPGDANRDGKVDDLDASILAANWQRTGGATWEQADFNKDGAVNDLDASILAANWQWGVGAAVPEPSTLVLLAGLALLGLARRARR